MGPARMAFGGMPVGQEHGVSGFRRSRPARGHGDFCATCWGAGHILRDARNGEGRVPVRCEWCHGAGIVHRLG